MLTYLRTSRLKDKTPAEVYATLPGEGVYVCSISTMYRILAGQGAQANDMGGVLVRTIGLVRAKAKIGTPNLAHNIRRLGQLGRLNPCPA